MPGFCIETESVKIAKHQCNGDNIRERAVKIRRCAATVMRGAECCLLSQNTELSLVHSYFLPRTGKELIFVYANA